VTLSPRDALLGLALTLGCASTASRAPDGETVQRAIIEGSHTNDSALAHGHRSHRDHVNVTCPVGMDDPGLVIARVRRTVITACDLGVAWYRHNLSGAHTDDARQLLDEVMRDALLAESLDLPAGVVDREVNAELAEALIRSEALAELAQRLPTDAEVERYYNDHVDDFTTPERVRLRQLVFPTEREAQEAIRAMTEGGSFDDLVPRSLDPLAGRDGGDLGFISREESHGLAPALVTAGFALTEIGGLTPAPVRFAFVRQVVVRAGRRARTRTQRSEAYGVLQLLDRQPELRVPLPEARERIRQRILRERYLQARNAARERLGAQFGTQARAAVIERGFSAVRVTPR